MKEFRSRSLSYENACVRIDVCDRDSQHEPRVSWRIGGHAFYSTDAAKCFMELGYAVERTSIYTAEVSSVARSLACTEHLAPVFLMWPDRSFNVDVECPPGMSRAEIPMMDGSAIKFFNALRNQAGVPGEIAFYDAPVSDAWELRRPGDGTAYGCVRIAPSDAFEVSYILDRPDMDGFHSEADVSVYSAEDLYNIFEARTFIMARDYEIARQNGLLAGVDESCGLLIDAKEPTLSQKYRVREEPALHKILDLLGDLAFVRPALPKIRVEILNGGHAAHRQIIEKVINYAIRFRICP